MVFQYHRLSGGCRTRAEPFEHPNTRWKTRKQLYHQCGKDVGMDRKQLGQQQLGAPVTAAFEALVDTVDQKPWPDFHREPVGYYFSKMLGGWLLRLMDNALSDEQLRAVSPPEVSVTALLLLRDMFRHNSNLLRPDARGAPWVEELFQEVAEKLGLPGDRIRDDGQPYELDDMENCGWAKAIAAPFGIVPEKLFACHSAIVTGAIKEFGRGQ
jgi:hypothetical protein